MLFFSYTLFSSNAVTAGNEPSSTENITVYSVPGLSGITSKWASEYGKQHPGLKINVMVVSETNLVNNLKSGGGLGFISNETPHSANQDQLWKVIIGRNVIVPVLSSKNPYLDEISRQGISPAGLSKSLENPAAQQWETLLRDGQNMPIHFYILNDESVKSGLANYLNVPSNKMMGVSVTNEKELIKALENDPYAIGFCRLIDIIDHQNQTITGNIKLLPLDKNGNGKMDYMEKIYADLQDFSRGVWIGKYPKELSSAIFSVSAEQPTHADESAFLTWVLTDGQQFLTSRGYSDLVYNERQSQLDKVGYPGISVSPVKDTNAIPAWLILTAITILAVTFVLGAAVRYRRKNKAVNPEGALVFPQIFDENSVIIPKGLYFDKTHTWAFMEEDGIVKIGIDDFLQHITGPITRIEMKSPGEKIKKGEELLSIIQNGKLLTLYAPITGTIKEQNGTLTTHSSYLNSSPYSNGWVYRIEPVNWSLEIQFLTMAEKYKNWLTREFTRLKDFLAISLQGDQLAYSHLVLQDGGVLKDGILVDLGPEVWEDFQIKFIDTAR